MTQKGFSFQRICQELKNPTKNKLVTITKALTRLFSRNGRIFNTKSNQEQTENAESLIQNLINKIILSIRVYLRSPHEGEFSNGIPGKYGI